MVGTVAQKSYAAVDIVSILGPETEGSQEEEVGCENWEPTASDSILINTTF